MKSKQGFKVRVLYGTKFEDIGTRHQKRRIYRRRKDHGTLADRLKSTGHITTAAMRQELAFEPVAAESYASVKDY